MAKARFRSVGRSTSLLSVAALLLASVTPAAFAADAPHLDCASLTHLALEDTRIVSAAMVSGGSLTPPGARRALAGLPAFCRVSAVISPAIRFELWLPLTDWNGKFEGTCAYPRVAKYSGHGSTNEAANFACRMP